MEHNVKRTRRTPEALKAKKEKELKEIKEYLAISDEILKRKSDREYTKEALERTTELLNLNPEFYTAWNYRREIFLNGIFPESTSEAINDILTQDLNMTMQQLKSYPKVYWIWNHRRWCLEHVPDGPGSEGAVLHGWKSANLDRELYVVENMLDRDARNFHAWAYRRYVLASHPKPKPPSEELAFTKLKIENNFSNFSAWHQRSKVYMSNLGAPSLALNKEAEFELVKSAIWTDPADQSAWIYHRWLVGSSPTLELLEREISMVEGLLMEEPESKWCLETLVHYRTQLLQQPAFTGERAKVRQDCSSMLLTLERIDPLRKHRYQDLKVALENQAT